MSRNDFAIDEFIIDELKSHCVELYRDDNSISLPLHKDDEHEETHCKPGSTVIIIE